MRNRCRRPSNPSWPHYGGRGITVCPEWADDFWQYVRDVGMPPEDGRHWSLDRQDNDGNYEPNNVRWVTGPDQTNNTRRSRVMPHLETIRQRLAAGETPGAIAVALGWHKTTIWRHMHRRPDLFADIPAVQTMKDNTYHSKVVPHLDYIRAQMALGRPMKDIGLELGFEISTISAFRRRNPDLLP
jgi:hypothetical protein